MSLLILGEFKRINYSWIPKKWRVLISGVGGRRGEGVGGGGVGGTLGKTK